MAIKTFTTGEVLTAADTNTYLANAGLVFVKSVTIGSGVSSIPVTNAYPTDYDTFRIVINAQSSTGNQSIFYRHVDSGGTDNSGSYLRAGYFMSSAALSAVFDSQSEWEVGRTTDGQAASCTFDVMFPNTARWAQTSTQVRGNTVALNFGQQHGSATAFPSFRIFFSGGATVTGGSITVYGYRKG
jgi:hypothetical protein